MKFYKISLIKSTFIELRDKMVSLDNSLKHIIVIDTSVSMCAIMLQIYALAQNNDKLKEFAYFFAFGTISEITKLIISCFINGLVYEQSYRIYAALDYINANHFDENEYKELILFKTISRDTMFGFTIVGFAPLEKKTLFSVIIKLLLM